MTMSTAMGSAGRRDYQPRPWTPSQSTVVRGRHRGGRSGPVQPGTAALLRRALSASAVWCLAFSTASFALDWAWVGLATLVIGALIVLGVGLSNASHRRTLRRPRARQVKTVVGVKPH